MQANPPAAEGGGSPVPVLLLSSSMGSQDDTGKSTTVDLDASDDFGDLFCPSIFKDLSRVIDRKGIVNKNKSSRSVSEHSDLENLSMFPSAFKRLSRELLRKSSVEMETKDNHHRPPNQPVELFFRPSAFQNFPRDLTSEEFHELTLDSTIRAALKSYETTTTTSRSTAVQVARVHHSNDECTARRQRRHRCRGHRDAELESETIEQGDTLFFLQQHQEREQQRLQPMEILQAYQQQEQTMESSLPLEMRATATQQLSRRRAPAARRRKRHLSYWSKTLARTSWRVIQSPFVAVRAASTFYGTSTAAAFESDPDENVVVFDETILGRQSWEQQHHDYDSSTLFLGHDDDNMSTAYWSTGTAMETDSEDSTSNGGGDDDLSTLTFSDDDNDRANTSAPDDERRLEKILGPQWQDLLSVLPAIQVHSALKT